MLWLRIEGVKLGEGGEKVFISKLDLSVRSSFGMGEGDATKKVHRMSRLHDWEASSRKLTQASGLADDKLRLWRISRWLGHNLGWLCST